MEQWEETSECKDTRRFRPLRAFVHSVLTSYTLAKNAVCSCSKSHFFCIAFGASALMYLSWIQETFANINPSWVCPPETWARSCESFSDVTLLGCSDPSQALHRLQYHRPGSQPHPAPLQPPSPWPQLRRGPLLLLTRPGVRLAFYLCCTSSLESSSARHVICSVIYPLSSHWGPLRMPHAKMQLLSTLKPILCFVFSCFTFVLYFL